MKKKIFILRHSEGEYDEHYTFTDAVLIGDAKYNFAELQSQYSSFIQKEIAKCISMGIKKPKIGKNYIEMQDWLVLKKGMKVIEYEESE